MFRDGYEPTLNLKLYKLQLLHSTHMDFKMLLNVTKISFYMLLINETTKSNCYFVPTQLPMHYFYLKQDVVYPDTLAYLDIGG